MAKRKIRLSESELINLIKKSLINEGTGTAQDPFTDTDLSDDVERVVDLMDGTAGFTGKLAGIVTGGAGWTSESDLNEVKKILEKYKGKYCKVADEAVVRPCLKRFMELYEDDEGDSLYDDLKGLYQSRYGSSGKETRRTIMNWLEADKDKQDVPKTSLAPTPTPTPNQQQQATQTNKFYCVENDSTYRAYGPAGNQYAEVQWKGGTLQFYLNGTPLGDGAPANDNILYQKGGKKWTTQGSCSEGGPGKPRGLILDKPWTPKTN